MLELANAGLADDGYGQGAHDRLMRAVEALERIGDQSALPALRQVSTGTVRPTERQLKMARHGDFDAGYEFLQRRETRYLALNQAIATLSGR